jgi:hypothetical protein
MTKEPSQEQPDGSDISRKRQALVALSVYENLIGRCRKRVRELTTVQFDPETGVRRYFFNGKLEKTTKVRGYGNKS